MSIICQCDIVCHEELSQVYIIYIVRFSIAH